MSLLSVGVCLSVAGCGSADPNSGISANADIGVESEAAIPSFDESIAMTVSELDGEAKKLYEEALAAEPFPQQEELITGQFHGEFKDDVIESYYQYDRQKDGIVAHVAVDMYEGFKEYVRDESSYRWRSKGRVIYEQDVEVSDWVYILLLDEVSDKSIKYHMISYEFDLSEVMESEDLRGPGEFPKLPQGWTEVSE